jgi:hypothetical protein
MNTYYSKKDGAFSGDYSTSYYYRLSHLYDDGVPNYPDLFPGLAFYVNDVTHGPENSLSPMTFYVGARYEREKEYECNI